MMCPGCKESIALRSPTASVGSASKPALSTHPRVYHIQNTAPILQCRHVNATVEYTVRISISTGPGADSIAGGLFRTPKSGSGCTTSDDWLHRHSADQDTVPCGRAAVPPLKLVIPRSFSPLPAGTAGRKLRNVLRQLQSLNRRRLVAQGYKERAEKFPLYERERNESIIQVKTTYRTTPQD